MRGIHLKSLSFCRDVVNFLSKLELPQMIDILNIQFIAIVILSNTNSVTKRGYFNWKSLSFRRRHRSHPHIQHPDKHSLYCLGNIRQANGWSNRGHQHMSYNTILGRELGGWHFARLFLTSPFSVYLHWICAHIILRLQLIGI